MDLISLPSGIRAILSDKLLNSPALVLVAQSCLTVCDPMDCSLPVSSVQEILRQEYWSGLPFPSPIVQYEVGKHKNLKREKNGKYYLKNDQSCHYQW